MTAALQNVFDTLRAYKRSRALAVAVDAGMLQAIHSGHVTDRQISLACGLAPEWATALLRTMASVELVRNTRDGWELTSTGLAACGDQAFLSFAAYHEHCYEAWLELPCRCHSVATAGGFHRRRIADPAFAQAYVRAMEAIAAPNLTFLERECQIAGRILDIGAGPSTFCRHLACSVGVQVTGLDLPPIVETAKQMFTYPASFAWAAAEFEEYCPAEPFDAVFCSHFLEYCPREHLPEWIVRIRSFLRPVGKGAFVVFLKSATTNSDELDLFELSTGLNGDRLGHIYTVDEFHAIMTSAGASNIRCVPFPAGASYSEYLVTSTWE